MVLDRRPRNVRQNNLSLSLWGGELMCGKGRAVVDVMPSSLDDNGGSWGGE